MAALPFKKAVQANLIIFNIEWDRFRRVDWGLCIVHLLSVMLCLLALKSE